MKYGFIIQKVKKLIVINNKYNIYKFLFKDIHYLLINKMEKQKVIFEKDEDLCIKNKYYYFRNLNLYS